MNRNEGTIDRLLRLLAATLLFMAAFFWVGGAAAIALYVLAFVAAFTGATGFCALYVPLKISTYRPDAKASRVMIGVIVALIVIAAAAGSYYSDFFTRKFFLEDFNRMNGPYKQTLFETGQGRRAEAIANYEMLVTEHKRFQDKYSSYRPYALRGDEQFAADVAKVAGVIAAVESGVRTGDLAQTHLDLEAIRPVYQEMLKRNGFSMLAVSLVDFHDAMEVVLDAANDKDAGAVRTTYVEADAKLRAVEEIVDDEAIMAIRAALEAVLEAAENDAVDSLPGLGNSLKGSFVKVYLERG